jgi:hypothetical protein
MIIKSIGEFCAQYDEPLDLLRVAWTVGGNMRHFRPTFTRLSELAAELAVGRVMLELNALPDVPVYDQLWLTTSFMPTVLKLPLKQVVIVLSAKRVYNQHVVEGLLMAVSPFTRFDVQFFRQPEFGLAWLTDDSPRLPGLLREWAEHCGAMVPAADEVGEPHVPYGQLDAAG